MDKSWEQRLPRVNKEDLVILVMGTTGSGKSTFVTHCSGESVSVGHGLHSHTREVEAVSFTFGQNKVHIIDTPGFNDSAVDDAETLAEVAYWLSRAYSNGVRLASVIYLHPVSNNRMKGSCVKSLQIFKALCGRSVFSQIMLVSTMWDRTDTGDATRRESELISTPSWWGDMIAQGAATHRSWNTVESAQSILKEILKQKSTAVLDIQKELVDQKLSLDHTAAGRVIAGDLIKFAEKMQREMDIKRQQARRQTEETLRDSEKELLIQHQNRIGSTESALQSINQNMKLLQERKEKEILEQLYNLEREWNRDQKKLQDLQSEVHQLENELSEQKRQRTSGRESRNVQKDIKSLASGKSARTGRSGINEFSVKEKMLEDSKIELKQVKNAVKAVEFKSTRRLGILGVSAGTIGAVLQGVALAMACTVM